jgi:RHS repeat-associated protein
LTFAYDPLGRLLSEADPLGTGAGRRLTLAYPDNALTVNYDYLVTGEMQKIRENGAASGIGLLATYAYDDLGRRTSLTRGNGTVTSYAYDQVSRLTSMTQDLAGSSNDLAITGFAYNPANQIAGYTRSNDLYAWTESYAVNRGYNANGLNQYSSAGTVAFAYDARGNLTSDGSVTFGYDSENKLMSASGTKTGSLTYDPRQRLYQVTGTSTTRFAYDGVDAIAEYDGTGSLLRRYAHGPGDDDPLVQYEGSSLTDRRWLHTDERGSVVASSDASGNMLSINTYDEYGIPGAANSGRFQYTGQMWLSDLGLYHYKARAYSPTMGRFLQTDPTGYDDGPNWYAYAGGDPVNGSDPSGTVGIDGGLGYASMATLAAAIAADNWAKELNKAPKPPPNFVPPTNEPQAPDLRGPITTDPTGAKVAPGPDGTTYRFGAPVEGYEDGYFVQTKPQPKGKAQPVDPSTGKPPSGPGMTRAEGRARTHVPLPEGWYDSRVRLSNRPVSSLLYQYRLLRVPIVGPLLCLLFCESPAN